MNFSLISPKQPSHLDLSCKVKPISSKPNLQEMTLNFSDINYGLVDCKVLAPPNLSLMFGNIQLQPNIKHKSETPDNRVNFPFLLEGEIASRFYSFPQKQLLTANSDNANQLPPALARGKKRGLISPGFSQKLSLTLYPKFLFWLKPIDIYIDT